MYSGGAQQNDMIAAMEAQLGLDVEIDVGCWPDNWPVLQVFDALKTQWNVTQGGVIGLRYEAIPVVFSEFGVTSKRRAAMMQSLRIMEDEVLKVFREG